jgi:hypothetical protein
VLPVLVVVVAVVVAGLVALWWKRGSNVGMRRDWEPSAETVASE